MSVTCRHINTCITLTFNQDRIFVGDFLQQNLKLTEDLIIKQQPLISVIDRVFCFSHLKKKSVKVKTLKIIFLSTSWFERKVVVEFIDGSQNIQFQYLNLAQVIPCSPQINRAWLYFFDFEKQVNKW